VALSGTLSYAAFTSEQISVTLSENESTRCSGSEISGQSPGVEVAKTTLTSPGPFAIAGNICWAGGSPPKVDLMARALDASGACVAGFITVLPPENASNIQLTLTPGPCPGRK
jgi:hypothetical protein